MEGRQRYSQSALWHQHLFSWWRKQGRILPWRQKQTSLASAESQSLNTTQLSVREQAFHHYFASSLLRDPYRVVVAELMLQQTQVERVLPKYEAWIKQWPTVADLARASLAEVLIFWQGLGYNRRARFLWLMAKAVAEDRHGQWPDTEADLMKLPGVGKYTARAILSFAMGQQVGVVDTNVKRVLQRWLGLAEYHEKQYFQLADEFVPAGQADPWNQALMDFGALVCTAKVPRCADCPVAQLCAVNQDAQAKGYQNYAAYFKAQASRQHNTQQSLMFGEGAEERTDRATYLVDQAEVQNQDLAQLQAQANHLIQRQAQTRARGQVQTQHTAQFPNQKMSKQKNLRRGKDQGLRFEQTDRYFRGRIIDELRSGLHTYNQLLQKLDQQYGLSDESRFQQLLNNLAREGLIQQNGNEIKIG